MTATNENDARQEAFLTRLLPRAAGWSAATLCIGPSCSSSNPSGTQLLCLSGVRLTAQELEQASP